MIHVELAKPFPTESCISESHNLDCRHASDSISLHYTKKEERDQMISYIMLKFINNYHGMLSDILT